MRKIPTKEASSAPGQLGLFQNDWRPAPVVVAKPPDSRLPVGRKPSPAEVLAGADVAASVARADYAERMAKFGARRAHERRMRSDPEYRLRFAESREKWRAVMELGREAEFYADADGRPDFDRAMQARKEWADRVDYDWRKPEIVGHGPRVPLLLRDEDGAPSAGGARLACQRDNISPPIGNRVLQAETDGGTSEPGKRPNNTGYRRRRAFEVETNIAHAIEHHGRAIAKKNGAGSVTREEAARIGTEHALEFTVTIPRQGRAKTASYFSRVWDRFNRKFLLKQSWVASWCMVKECHKSGEMHAHCLLLVWRSVRRLREDGGKMKIRFYNRNGKTVVSGRSIAEWIPELWQRLRSERQEDGSWRVGILEKYGLGSSHTLQPIKSAGAFGKYIAKYLTKGFKEDRPAHFKGVRLVAYSHSFPRCIRVFNPRPVESDHPGLREGERATEKRERIWYRARDWKRPKWEECPTLPDHFYIRAHAIEFDGFTGKVRVASKIANRLNMAQTFSFNGPMQRYRRRTIGKLARRFGARDYDDLARIFGPKWAYYAEPSVALWLEDDWGELSESAIAYKLGGVSRFSGLEPIFTDGNRECRYRALAHLSDEARAQFEFAWEFEGKASGKRIPFEFVETALFVDRARWMQALQAQAEAVASGSDLHETRAFKRTLE